MAKILYVLFLKLNLWQIQKSIAVKQKLKRKQKLKAQDDAAGMVATEREALPAEAGVVADMAAEVGDTVEAMEEDKNLA
jgi:hypothetical protein